MLRQEFFDILNGVQITNHQETPIVLQITDLLKTRVGNNGIENPLDLFKTLDSELLSCHTLFGNFNSGLAKAIIRMQRLIQAHLLEYGTASDIHELWEHHSQRNMNYSRQNTGFFAWLVSSTDELFRREFTNLRKQMARSRRVEVINSYVILRIKQLQESACRDALFSFKCYMQTIRDEFAKNGLLQDPNTRELLDTWIEMYNKFEKKNGKLTGNWRPSYFVRPLADAALLDPTLSEEELLVKKNV